MKITLQGLKEDVKVIYNKKKIILLTKTKIKANIRFKLMQTIIQYLSDVV